MPEVIAVRIEPLLLKKIDTLGKAESVDRSTLIRMLIKKGYGEILKEKSAQEYVSGKITISEAAHRAGLTIWEMENYLVDRGFKSDYSIDDLENELALLR